MNEKSKGFLRLLLRSKDLGDGWRQVSNIIWPLVIDFPHIELLEIKDNNMVRLSERGLIVVDYI
jgi:hypothetical protein